ncbi:hypothetical protein [Bacillus sp. AFS088145]|uniref:hypothetical protein n=1 Tax=Bacillus sp. AFS088145 TaxID=2033514 RepID=UPI000BF424C3|nr:hypothetical protein [Bacillus sp. AFS088145]PFH91384.1 hypothetical protein COI44_01910 [Bacillus sp. AFS088145]
MKLHGAIEFLKDYPEMSFSPFKEGQLTLKGTFSFIAKYDNGPVIEDSYKIEIMVPETFPFDLPLVTELEKKIPRDLKHHINPDDSLCIGSPLRVIMKLYDSPTLNTYAERCLVPYLYAISHKLIYGGAFVFGELEHGVDGIFYDYCDIFGLTKPKQLIGALLVLSKKKRDANKNQCPCNCGNRLGICKFNIKINKLRKVAPRSFYRKQYEILTY